MIFEGLVMRSTGSWYEVRNTDGHIFSCRLKGKFKIAGIKSNNPIAVGDRVVCDTTGESENQAIIFELKPRDNYIVRQSVHKTAHSHILASNLDQAVLIVTLNSPKTSLGFIDRFLVSAEAYEIPVLIVFNKYDVLTNQEKEQQEYLISLYESLHYSCLVTSATQSIGIENLRKALQNKISLVAGHSGVGKSTLLNGLSPELNLSTTEISTFANKGVHTTTFATMFELENDSFIIDSPGIKELGLVDMKPEELSHFFPEMRDKFNQCKYHNCKHVNEPKCAVIEAFIAGEIAESRYASYISMIESDDNRR